jgi:hypothetical protein
MNKAARKIIEQEEIPQRNCWFDEECKIILEGKKKDLTSIWLTETLDKMKKYVRIKVKKHIKY